MKNQITQCDPKELDAYLKLCEAYVKNNPIAFAQFKQMIEGMDLNIIRKTS